jgi:hypothetical protein
VGTPLDLDNTTIYLTTISPKKKNAIEDKVVAALLILILCLVIFFGVFFQKKKAIEDKVVAALQGRTTTASHGAKDLLSFVKGVYTRIL